MICILIPVSYTHLDVYKRQVEKKAEEIHISPLDKEEEIELTELLQQINFSSSQKDESQPILEVAKQSEQTEEIIENNEEEKSSPVFEVFLNIIYIFAISFLVLFAGIIVYITFIHQFEMDQGIFHTIHVVFQAYHSFVNMIFEGILDFLHTFILSLIHICIIYLSISSISKTNGRYERFVFYISRW